MIVAIILLFILTIAATIAAYILVIPERRRPYLNPFWSWVRDFLNMRHLYLERILRGLYVYSTIFTLIMGIGAGVITPFALVGSDAGFGTVLLSLVVGLIAGALLTALLLFLIRIGYENVMLKVSLTDAAKCINEKLGGSPEPRNYEPRGGYENRGYEKPRRRPAPPRPVVCRRCGARYDPRRGRCPHCDDRW